MNTLDPRVAAIQVANPRVPYAGRTPDEARAISQGRIPPSPDVPLAAVEDFGIELPGRTLPVRLYRPRRDGRLPLLVYLHGGGFVLGNLDSEDAAAG